MSSRGLETTGRGLSEAGTPALSVIIPTFNRADALLTCLAHLERQTCSDFEVIVIDDGSTDTTPIRMEQYLENTPLRMRYIRQQNAGPARARNQGIAVAASPLCFITGDDIFASPGLLATHLRLHQQRPESNVAALGLTQWCQEGQTVTPFMRWLDESGTQFSYHDLLRGTRPGWKHFYTSNLSVKTALLRQNPFRESFTRATMEDIELGYRLEKLHALELVFLPEALASHLHPTSFLQACRRLDGVGRSVHLFHEMWPEHAPASGTNFRRRVADAVHRHPWLLALVRKVTDVVTKWWCPNPFLRHVLDLHTAVGYRNHKPFPQTAREAGHTTEGLKATLPE